MTTCGHRSCSVCSHEDRREIDDLLISGIPLREIEEAYGVSRSTLSRHKQGRRGRMNGPTRTQSDAFRGMAIDLESRVNLESSMPDFFVSRLAERAYRLDLPSCHNWPDLAAATGCLLNWRKKGSLLRRWQLERVSLVVNEWDQSLSVSPTVDPPVVAPFPPVDPVEWARSTHPPFGTYQEKTLGWILEQRPRSDAWLRKAALTAWEGEHAEFGRALTICLADELLSGASFNESRVHEAIDFLIRVHGLSSAHRAQAMAMASGTARHSHLRVPA